MSNSADFRERARNALSGKWKLAVLVGFLASLLGGGIANSGGGGGSGSNSSDSGSLMQSLETLECWPVLQTVLVVATLLLVLWALALLVLSGGTKLGNAIFNLKLVDGKDAKLSDLFSQYHRLGQGFCMNFLVGLYTFLWTLLFIIPGIIKGFSYAMTPYILAEHPEYSVSDAITESRRIMNGNKWRLFCLGFSFIGWGLLIALPLVIALFAAVGVTLAGGAPGVWLWLIPTGLWYFVGSLFLFPYREAAYAAFYREVSGPPAWVQDCDL